MAIDQWAFRGQPDADAELKSTLERIREHYSIKREDLPEIEAGLIRKFKRQYYHYSGDSPDPLDYPEWLAIMRHFGAPTRLLDWTYSFFVGVFFAIENSKTDAALWAINTTALDKKLKEQLPKVFSILEYSRNVQSLRQFQSTFGRRPPVPFVANLLPYRLNQRLAVQQGLFLCPGDLTKSFIDNLAAVLGDNPSESVLVKLRISGNSDFRIDLSRRLYRMNMNSASLFPGLDGFARSLEQFLSFGKKFLSPDLEYSKGRAGRKSAPGKR